MLKKFPLDRQMDTMDCGPACLKMIAKYFGKFYSLQHMRDKCGITKEGISLADLSHAAEGIGLRSVALRCTIDDLVNKIPLPVSFLLKRLETYQCIVSLDNSQHPKRSILRYS